MNSSGINENDAVAFRSSLTSRLNNMQRYGLAVVSVGFALGASLLLQHFGFRVPSEILLLFAVAISSWYGGRGPAVLAVILSTISFYWYFVQPVRTFYIYWSQIPHFVIFTAFAVLVAWFGTVRRRKADLRHSRGLLRGQASFLSPALRLALIYAFFGALWILVSDRLSFYLVPDLQQVERLQTYKGWFFIALTALLLWLLATRFVSEVGEAQEALHRLNRKLRAISNCNQALLRTTDEQSLLENICRIVCEEAGYRMAFVAYAEHDEAKTVRPVAWTGAEAGYLKTAGLTWADTERGRGPTGTAIRTGESCCIQDLATDPRVAPWTESLLQRGFRSATALSLKNEQAVPFGSLTIFSSQPNAFTPAETALLEELAGDLAYGITTLQTRAERERAQAALRINERRYRTAEAVGHVGNWEYDVQTTRYWGSDEAKRMFGFDSGQTDFTTDEVENCISERDRVHQALVDLIEVGKPYSLEFEMRPRGSTEVRVIWSVAQIMRDQKGNALKVAGSIRDITERKRAEEALRRSEAYLAEAQRLTHTGAWATDGAPKPLYWSEELFRLYGLDPKDGVPTHELAMQRVHPEDRDKYAEAFRRVIREKVDSDVEFRTVLPDGAIKHLYGLGHPVLNANGELVEVVGTTVDITERKRSEEALRESETRFRTFVNHAADAFFMLDFEQRIIIDANQAACDSLGYTRQELIGQTPLAFHLDSHLAEMKLLAERAVTGESVFDRHWHRRKDGSLFPVEVHTNLISYDGHRFLLKVARDISDRVRAEEQREKLRQLEAEIAHLDRLTMLGELTASIAHEVNQPLSGVVSNGSACLRWLAGETPNLEEAREATRRIVRDGKRAAEVISRIRAMTKKAAENREKLDLNETIREVLALVGDEAKKNRVVIRTEFADEVFPVVGDRVQLQQVVLNLIMNGIEAMSSVGEKTRELAITTRNTDSNQVQVTVQDSGIGLDPEAMPKVFEPFYTTKTHGMGMGLSISRSILQAHGGQLWAAANEGPGTSFHFTLPRHEEESHAAA